MDIKELYQGLWSAVNGICDKCYLKNRPRAASVKERPDTYIVIRLPFPIVSNEIGDEDEYNDFSTMAQIEIYVRDKVSNKNVNELNVSVLSTKVSKVRKLFPISNKTFVAYKPTVRVYDDDGDGFSVAIIQCVLKTK